MHSIISQALGVSGRLSKTADCQFIKRAAAVSQCGGTALQPGALSGAQMLLLGYRVSRYPEPSPRRPRPRLATPRHSSEASALLALAALFI